MPQFARALLLGIGVMLLYAAIGSTIRNLAHEHIARAVHPNGAVIVAYNAMLAGLGAACLAAALLP